MLAALCMSAISAAMLGRLLAGALVAAVAAATAAAVSVENGGHNETKREVAGPFLTDVIQRINSDRRPVARPVQDLQ